MPFQISLSRGGGFTGLVRGYRLHANGQVEAWQSRPGQPAKVTWQQQVDITRVRAVQEDLEATGVLGAVHSNTGNMTTRVTYDLPDTIYSWSWTGDPPAELAAWYSETRQWCAALAPDKNGGQ